MGELLDMEELLELDTILLFRRFVGWQMEQLHGAAHPRPRPHPHPHPHPTQGQMQGQQGGMMQGQMPHQPQVRGRGRRGGREPYP